MFDQYQRHLSDVQVVEKLIRGLAMEDSRNMFALFEHKNNIDRAVESRVIVADVLAKFERSVVQEITLFESKMPLSKDGKFKMTNMQLN